MVDFYKSLLGSLDNRNHCNPVVFQAGAVLSREDSDSLIAPVSNDEIKRALWSIDSEKSPGLDGFNSFFFKKTWGIVGNEICQAVQEFFSTGKLLKQISCAILVVLPEKPNAEHLNDFRPISCCTVLYKIISKVLCVCLSSVLPRLIAKNQCAFIHGRKIIDNILIAHELVRNNHRGSAKANCALKIDIRKDSVAWDFVEEVLHGLLFPAQFIVWIM
ncbi:DNAse I-like superfamily protein [Euphorbia peplus]|nr:DNAse I-like superfamily protein [Euphorbia peplus]